METVLIVKIVTEVVPAIIAAASVAVAVFPAPKDEKGVWAKVRKAIMWAAVNVGNARK